MTNDEWERKGQNSFASSTQRARFRKEHAFTLQMSHVTGHWLRSDGTWSSRGRAKKNRARRRSAAGPELIYRGADASPLRLAARIDADLRLSPLAIIDVIAIVMMPAFAPDIMTVDPMMTVIRPMAWHPHHFVFTRPVARAMTVVWPVTEFDSKSLRLNDAPESKARNTNRHEQ